VVFLHAFSGVYNGDWHEKVLRESTAQEVSVVEAVSVDNPPGDITVFDETLGGIGGLDPLLHTRTPTG